MQLQTRLGAAQKHQKITGAQVHAMGVQVAEPDGTGIEAVACPLHTLPEPYDHHLS